MSEREKTEVNDMGNALLNALGQDLALTHTENGAIALNDTGNDLLNLFGIVGSMRKRLGEVSPKFTAAMAEDKLHAAKLAFYARDIRGGLGERDVARIMFRTMAIEEPDIARKNLRYVPEFGRWDDMLVFLGTPVEQDAVQMISEQLQHDMENMQKGKPVSLLAKWLPSVNASAHKTKMVARDLAAKLGMTEREYRKTLSALRAYLNVTEVRLTDADYGSIKYDAVPSYAMKKYRAAFFRNDAENFAAYLENVKNGKAKINAATLYPYDIVEKYMFPNGIGYFINEERIVKDDILEEQWKALPNYIEGENNFLVMVDVSGSMMGRPIATSVGLGIYFAERNKGEFANTFMTFTDVPRLVKLKGNSLADKVRHVLTSGVGYNTNLELAFNAVLETAVKHGVPAEDMPKSIIVISDMEIDSLVYQTKWTFVEEMKKRYSDAGYELPNLVLWNVDSRNDVYHASGYAANVQMCSGQSASVFKTLLGSVGMTPYEYMMSVLDDPRYEVITAE